MQPIRFGICGTGDFGRTRARALNTIHGAKVSLGWSRRQETRDRFSRECSAPSVKDWEHLCSSPEVDAVFVCSADVDHLRHSKAALEAGKHVLVEVPLSPSADLARELAQIAERKSLVLHHGLMWRYCPDYAQDIEQTRRVGPLLHGIEHAFWDFGPDRMWMADPAFNAGGRDFLAFFMPRWMEAFGEVHRVTGSQSRAEDWCAASITMDFEAGGYITVSYSLGNGILSRPVEMIVGTHGMLHRNHDGNRVFTTQQGSQRLPNRAVDLVQCECEAFRDEILGLRDHRPALQYDLRALELVDRAIPPDSCSTSTQD